MNYFELFNKVMLELNYRQITVFENIFKSEHLRILENLNRVNSEICATFDWPFLARQKLLTLNAGEISINNAVEGKIQKVFEGAKQLHFNPFYERFYNDSAEGSSYGYFDDELLLAKSTKNRNIKVFYNTNKIVKAADGTPKELFTLQDDEPIIPMPFAEQVLVYGTCIRTKANPSFPKFPFWNLMFKEALIKLRATCALSHEEVPKVRLKRK